MDQLIIGIHGLGNKPSKKLLERWWKKSILEGLQRINISYRGLNFELVYWADILYPQPLKLSIKDKNDPLFLDEPYILQAGPSRKLPQNRFLTGIFTFFERQLDRVFLNKDMSLKFPALTETVIKRYFRDLEIYYSGEKLPLRQAIRERLTDALDKYKDKEIMLIAHSMGSIIAYDVLMHLKPDIKINTLITVGSPLGLPMIVSRIFNELKAGNKKLKQLCTPANITHHWYNISDIDDKVALDHTLADDYGSNNYNVRAFDISVYNDYIINGERNPHKIYGYLRARETTQIIAHFLTAKHKAIPIPLRWSSLKTWFSTRISQVKNSLKI